MEQTIALQAHMSLSQKEKLFNRVMILIRLGNVIKSLNVESALVME
jgi:hypothetical protein